MKSKYLSKASLFKTMFVLFLLYSNGIQRKETGDMLQRRRDSKGRAENMSNIKTHNIVIAHPDQPTDPQGC